MSWLAAITCADVHHYRGEDFRSSRYKDGGINPQKDAQKFTNSEDTTGMKPNPFPEEVPASRQIDAIIAMPGDWRGSKFAHLRAVIKQADPAVVEEVKWKKPSNPMGVPVWSHDGILCIGDTLKSAVRLTFPKGAQIKDPDRLFNTRLDSNTVRAIDFHEGDTVDEAALTAVILEAVNLNTTKAGAGTLT